MISASYHFLNKLKYFNFVLSWGWGIQRLDLTRRRETGRETEREISICHSTYMCYLCIPWFILSRALKWERAHKLGACGRHFNPQNYQAKALVSISETNTSASYTRCEADEM